MTYYNIVTIDKNNKDINNDFINLIKQDINNMTLSAFEKYIDDLKFELDECLKNKNIIYKKEFSYEDTLENQINDIFVNQINDKIDYCKKSGKISSYILKYCTDYYIVLYFNEDLLNLYLNNDFCKKFNPNNDFNLLASILMNELNVKSNTIFGSIFLIKFNYNHEVINISDYEIFLLIKDLLYVQYYTEFGVPGIYIDNKDKYKTYFKKNEVKIYDEYNLINLNIEDKNIWNKYYLRINKTTKDTYDLLNLTDKFNLISVDGIDEVFCLDNITNTDLDIIKKLSL